MTDPLAAGIPCGPMLDYGQIFGGDPHAYARGMVRQVEQSAGGTVRMLGSAMKLGDTPVTIGRPPPLLGQHTAEVLAESVDTRREQR